MDRHGIQVNKTSRNTVLFMTNIGTTRSSVALPDRGAGRASRASSTSSWTTPAGSSNGRLENNVRSLMQELPPLPDFSRFHDAFRSGDPTGDARG